MFDHPWWMVAEGRPFHSITWEKPLNPFGNEPFSSHHTNFENEGTDRRAQRYTSLRPSGRERDIRQAVGEDAGNWMARQPHLSPTQIGSNPQDAHRATTSPGAAAAAAIVCNFLPGPRRGSNASRPRDPDWLISEEVMQTGMGESIRIAAEERERNQRQRSSPPDGHVGPGFQAGKSPAVPSTDLAASAAAAWVPYNSAQEQRHRSARRERSSDSESRPRGRSVTFKELDEPHPYGRDGSEHRTKGANFGSGNGSADPQAPVYDRAYQELAGGPEQPTTSDRQNYPRTGPIPRGV